MKKQKLKKLPKAKVRRNNLLIIGLGNPGSKYRETRHNAGFAVIDNLASKSGLYLGKPFFKKYLIGRLKTDSGIIYLVKPLTFMNRSGMILNEIFRKTGASASEMILVCDNMDLKPGMIRLKTRGSSAGHNGIKSVIDNIGSEDFKRLYIGVGRPVGGESIIDHVLGEFNAEDRQAFDEAVGKASDSLLSLTEKPIEQVMNEINKRNN